MIGTEQYTDKYIMERMEIMSKVAVVYWSGTGNTAAMATAVAEGAQGRQFITIWSIFWSR